MKKAFVFTLICFFICLFHSKSFAWYMSCQGRSCVATLGGVKVSWSAKGIFNPTELYDGFLTGVEGLPVTFSDFQSVEKKVDQTIEKSITRKKSSSNSVGSQIEGIGSNFSSEKDFVFSKKQSMSQSKTMGENVSVDMTLAFVKWIGDNFFPDIPGIRKYLGAVELIMVEYQRGNVLSLVEKFFLARKGSEIESIDMTAKMTDENKNLFLIKYLSVTFPCMNPSMNLSEEKRFECAGARLFMLENAPIETVKNESERFTRVMQNFKEIVKPGITALDLYHDGKKDIAFAKWLADNNLITDASVPLFDKYVYCLNAVDVATTDPKFDEKKTFETLKAMFEDKIARQDPSALKVTIPKKHTGLKIAGLITLITLAVAAVVLIKKKKKSNH